MNLDNVVVVLAKPEESRNIGAVCRAMANCAIHSLRIVGHKEDIDEERVRILSIHAFDIYKNALFFDSITQATSDCVCSAGTTRRRGKKRADKLLLPEGFASYAGNLGEGKVALVFGNERAGLSDTELLECTMGVTIPSDEGFPSLNLSHAVQIMCYELFRSAKKVSAGYNPVSLERLDKTVTSLADSLQQIGFFVRTGRPEMEHFWRQLLSRAAISEGEAQYIEKIFCKTAGLAGKNNG